MTQKLESIAIIAGALIIFAIGITFVTAVITQNINLY